MGHLAELEGMRRAFEGAAPQAPPHIRSMLFKNSGLFDAIASEMTAEEVPPDHIVVVTDKTVSVQMAPEKREPPLTRPEFIAALAVSGEVLLATSDPRTSNVVSAFLNEHPAALGHVANQ